MTQVIFLKWLKGFDARMAGCNVLLIMDNCSAHIPLITPEFAELVSNNYPQLMFDSSRQIHSYLTTGLIICSSTGVMMHSPINSLLHQESSETMELFKQMQKRGMRPDRFTFVPVLNACAGLRALEEGRRAHQLIMQTGCEADVFVGSGLVDMYAKCGHMEDALRVFNKMPSRDVVTWSALILGHVKYGQGQKALELFRQMQQEDAFVGSSLVDMYAKCGSMEDAWRVFCKMPSQDVVTWTAMILGYVRCGQGEKALELYKRMQQEGVQPNAVTFTGVLNACASLMALEEGRSVHQQMIQCACHLDAFVGSSLVDMYAKCGSMEDAWSVFNKMPSRDAVTWTAMIMGHVNCGQGQKALDLFHQMQEEGVQPDAVTFVGVLNACASIMALEEGRRAHERIIQSRCESNVFVRNSLVDMYAKCGSMEDACRVFNTMPSHDVVSWNALLGGFAMHGQGKEALVHFERMCEEGVHPDDITFVCLLSACSHSGFVDEGLRFYALMTTVYRIPAKLEHYTCMVDLLGRAGHLQEAENMIQGMPCKPNAAIWMALLGACRIHGNVEMGERMAKRVLELEPKNAAGFVLLSNLYAATGNLELSENVERQRKERDAKKQPGRTWIEVNDATGKLWERNNSKVPDKSTPEK
ncbi:unnamed protein product [Sphagnum troendelagicum]